MDIDRKTRTPQQLLYLKEKLAIQEIKMKRLRELTKEYEDEAIVKLKTPKDVRNRGDWIAERRKLCTKYKIAR